MGFNSGFKGLTYTALKWTECGCTCTCTCTDNASQCQQYLQSCKNQLLDRFFCPSVRPSMYIEHLGFDGEGLREISYSERLMWSAEKIHVG